MGEAALGEWPWAVRLNFEYEDGKRYCKLLIIEIVPTLANNEIIPPLFEIQSVEDP